MFKDVDDLAYSYVPAAKLKSVLYYLTEMNLNFKGIGISLVNAEPKEISYISIMGLKYSSESEYEKKGNREISRVIENLSITNF